MAGQNKFLPPRGFRDIQPREAMIRQELRQIAWELGLSFGFQPIETPTVEYKEVLMGKYGQEADKLIFEFQDRKGRSLALRYDQTVPLARYINHFQPNLPFKRFQIQSSFRAEKPQRNRYREFTQIDFDIVGDDSFIADLEILWLTALFFQKIDLEVSIFYNSRRVLYKILELAGFSEKDYLLVAQIIDKLDKKPKDKVYQEFLDKGFKKSVIDKLWSLLGKAKPSDELKELINLVSDKVTIDFVFSPYLVRGLDYYTGLIFEIKTGGERISLAGGGRYNHLIKQNQKYLPAVGVGIGLDRLVEFISQSKFGSVTADYLILPLDVQVVDYALKVAEILRSQGKKVYFYPLVKNVLDRGLKYALKEGIKKVIFIGSDEEEGGYITLKDLDTKKQSKVAFSALNDR